MFITKLAVKFALLKFLANVEIEVVFICCVMMLVGRSKRLNAADTLNAFLIPSRFSKKMKLH